MMIRARLLFQPVQYIFWGSFRNYLIPRWNWCGFLFWTVYFPFVLAQGVLGCLASLGMLGWIQLTAGFPGNCISLMPWFDSFSALISLGNSAILALILFITSWYDSSCDLVR